MARLADRRVAITVDTFRFVNNPSLAATPLVLANGTPARGFRVSFKVERSHDSKANKAQAQIWNLNEDTRGKISIPTLKPQFIIEAGYRESFAQIFKGEAVEISTTRNMPGVVTTVKAQDGFRASKQRISKSFSPGTEVGDIIADVMGSLKINASKGLARARSGDLTGGIKQIFNGLTVSGNSKEELDKLAKTYGFDWSIQDDELQVLLPEEATPEVAVVMTPSTGLIGSPTRVLDDKRPKKNIVRGRSLLIPAIKPGRLIQLDSLEISGSFRTLTVMHTGQSDGGDFFSEWEGEEIK